MAGARLTHPSAAELTDFAVGKLDDARAEAIAAHLGVCEACRLAVERAPDDAFGDRIRAADRAGSFGVSVVPGGSGPKLGDDVVPPELAEHPRYRIIRKLGQGGMGVVYLAQHKVMDDPRAIKVISQRLVDHPDALARFHREVKAAAKLKHPNIAAAYDAEQFGSLQTLVMEYVEGLSVDRVLARGGPFPVGLACNCIRQAALGLQHAYEQGMVHRDIKPQNLMLTPRGQIKLLDFGLARMASERKPGKGLTADGAYMGTPEFMSPEQATDARTADIRADIYSLGCTLFSLLTGRPPFQEDTLVKMALAHINQPPPDLTRLRPDVPAKLAEIVATMLAKEPIDRHQTPTEVARALQPFCKVDARPAPMAAPFRAPALAPANDTRMPHPPPAQPGPGQGWRPSVFRAASLAKIGGLFGLARGKKRPAVITLDSEPPRAEAPPLTLPRARVMHPIVIPAVLFMGIFFALATMIIVVVALRNRDGIVELSELPDGAEVFVDQAPATVTHDGKKAEVHVKPDASHKIEVKVDGEIVLSETTSVTPGGRKAFRVRAPGTSKSKNDSKPGTAPVVEKDPGTSNPSAPITHADDDHGVNRLKMLKAPFTAAEARAAQQAWAQHLGTPVEQTIDLGGGERMTFVLIPPGEFMMGATDAEKAEKLAADLELPRHLVTISQPMYVSKYTTTRGQFRRFASAANYTTEAERTGGWGWNPAERKFEGERKQFSWKSTGFEQTDNHPVVNVTWNDAKEFCTWLGERKWLPGRAKLVRLPREAEFEYACRAGTTTRYYSGDDPASLNRIANIGDAALRRTVRVEHVTAEHDDGYAFTSPVGMFNANAFGLHDMIGNVWQWCDDRYRPYTNDRMIDPVGSGNQTVARGGTFITGPSLCRAAQRGTNTAPSRLVDLGFRVVLTGLTRVVTPESLAAPFTAAQARAAQEAWADYLGTKVEEAVSLAGGETMTFVLIPPGEFLMGASDTERGEKNVAPEEFPQHSVSITRPIYLAKYPTTISQYKVYAMATRYVTEAERSLSGAGFNPVTKALEFRRGFTWKLTGFEQSERHPVHNLTWHEAKQFCKWIAGKTGFAAGATEVRLPREAEWEYTCRAGTTTRHYAGDDPKEVRRIANIYDEQAKTVMPTKEETLLIDDGYPFTSPVGQFSANAFGLYDMLGNVWQWCDDARRTYTGDPQVDPDGGVTLPNRVARGGYFGDAPRLIRSARRGANEPSRCGHAGFRVVIVPRRPSDPPPSSPPVAPTPQPDPDPGPPLENDGIRRSIDSAKALYDHELKTARQDVLDALDRREAMARKEGDKKLVEQIARERVAFTEREECPAVSIEKFHKDIVAARGKMLEAYKSAIAEYTKERKDAAATRVEKELDKFRRDAWRGVNIEGAIAEDDFLRIKPSSSIFTQQEYTGPIEVIVVARTEGQSIRLRAYRGSVVIFNWENNPRELRVCRPDGNDNPESGSIATARMPALKPNTWYLLRWRMLADGIQVFANDQLIFQERRANDATAKGAVSVNAQASKIDVSLFRVRSITSE